MSCVADAKAISQNTASESCTAFGAGNASATIASAAPTVNCSPTIHPRFVPNRSTSGDHSGLMTHGRYSQLVSSAISVFDSPRFLYRMTDTVITTT